MGKEIATQVQEAQRVPYTMNPRRNTLRHTVIKLAKIKDKEKYERIQIMVEFFIAKTATWNSPGAVPVSQGCEAAPSGLQQ